MLAVSKSHPTEKVPIELWNEHDFVGRSIAITTPKSTDKIPIPDDEVVCDFCNGSITEFPVKVVGTDALCKECFEKSYDIEWEKRDTHYDLLYMVDQKEYNELQKEILEAFPDAKLEDASDEIHNYRFSITIGLDKKREFWKFAMKHGFHNCCFSLECMMMDDKMHATFRGLVAEVVKEIDEEKKQIALKIDNETS